MNASMSYVTLHHEVREPVSPGEGRTLLWLHGNLFRASQYYDLVDLLPRYRHVLVDYRGHGGSAAVATGITYEQNAADIGQLIDMLGFSNLVVIGHSQGNAIALRLAAQRPELVSAGVALAGVPITGLPDSNRELLSSLPALAGNREALVAMFEQMFVRDHTGLGAAAAADSAAIVSAEVIAAYGEQLLRDDSAELAPAIRQPWRVLVPELDEVVSHLRQIADAARLVNSTVEVVHGEGHIWPQEQPQDAVDRIEQFIALL